MNLTGGNFCILTTEAAGVVPRQTHFGAAASGMEEPNVRADASAHKGGEFGVGFLKKGGPRQGYQLRRDTRISQR